MEFKNILLIIVIIGLICAVAGLAIELQEMKKPKSVNNNTTNKNVNKTVEHISNDTVQKKDNSKSSSDGNNHYIDSNGREMVGTPNGQHMSVEDAEYVAEHGMR